MWLYIVILTFIFATFTIAILALNPKSKNCKINFSFTKWINFEINTSEKAPPSDQDS